MAPPRSRVEGARPQAAKPVIPPGRIRTRSCPHLLRDTAASRQGIHLRWCRREVCLGRPSSCRAAPLGRRRKYRIERWDCPAERPAPRRYSTEPPSSTDKPLSRHPALLAAHLWGGQVPALGPGDESGFGGCVPSENEARPTRYSLFDAEPVLTNLKQAVSRKSTFWPSVRVNSDNLW